MLSTCSCTPSYNEDRSWGSACVVWLAPHLYSDCSGMSPMRYSVSLETCSVHHLTVYYAYVFQWVTRYTMLIHQITQYTMHISPNHSVYYVYFTTSLSILCLFTKSLGILCIFSLIYKNLLFFPSSVPHSFHHG